MSSEQATLSAHGAHGHGHADDGEVHAHIASWQFYLGILGALIVFTIITVAVSYFDFGSANILIAIGIATAKAALVATFFMHLRHDKLFNTFCLLAAFLFLADFILLTYDDLGRRAEVDHDYGGSTDLRSGQAAPGSLPPVPETTIDDQTKGEGAEGEKGAAEAPKGEPKKE